MLRARERHPQRSLAEHYNPLSMDPILLKAHNNLDREVDKAFDVARKLTNERQRQELLFASYGELARGYVSSLSSKSKPPAGSFPVRVILIGPAAGCRTLSLATPGTMTVPDENTSLLPDCEMGRWRGEEEPVTWKRSIQSLVCNLGGRVAGSIPRERNHDCVSERDENNPALRRISPIPRPRAVKTVCTIA